MGSGSARVAARIEYQTDASEFTGSQTRAHRIRRFAFVITSRTLAPWTTLRMPRRSTWPQRHPPSALTKHRSVQAPEFATWAQAGLEQKSALPVRALIRCSRFGRIACASSTGCAPLAHMAPKIHPSGGGHTGQLPPATRAAAGNRTSRRRSAMRLSPLSSPKQWLKSLHSVHTGVVHKMRPSSSQSVR